MRAAPALHLLSSRIALQRMRALDRAGDRAGEWHARLRRLREELRFVKLVSDVGLDRRPMTPATP